MYNKHMNYLRKPAVIIAGIFLPPVLFSFGFLLAFGHVFGTPDRLKHALEQSNIYEAAVASLVRQGGTENRDTTAEGGVPSSQKAVQDAVTEALPSETLHEQTTEVLDGVYAWLQGDNAQLEFQIDLTEIQGKLATSLSEQARTQASQLPACGPDAAVSSQDFDPFGAECLPAGTDPNIVAEKTRQEVTSSELFKDPVLDASDIKSKDGKPLQEQLKPLSDVHGAVRGFTLASGILSAVLAVIVVFLSTSLHAGLRRLGIILLSVGAISAGLALAATLVMKAVVNAVARASGEDAIQSAAAKAVQLLANDIRTWWLGFGLIIGIAGIGMLIGHAVLKKRQTAVPNRTAPARRSSAKP
jgi:hypothetical protein